MSSSGGRDGGAIFQRVAQKNAANGYAGLDAAAVLPYAQGGPMGSLADLAGMQLWHDLSQQTGYNDGDPVNLLTDFSINGYAPVQATADNQPIFKTNQINGKPVLRFDPGSFPQFLEYSGDALSGLFTSWSAWTVFVVLRSADTGPDSMFSAIGSLDGGGNERVVFSALTSRSRCLVSIDDSTSPPSFTGTVYVDDPLRCTLAIALRWDGSQPLADTIGSIVSTTDIDMSGLSVGSMPSVACSNIQLGGELQTGFDEFGWQGDIAEFAVFDRLCSPRECRLAIEHLSEKWAA